MEIKKLNVTFKFNKLKVQSVGVKLEHRVLVNYLVYSS